MPSKTFANGVLAPKSNAAARAKETPGGDVLRASGCMTPQTIIPETLQEKGLAPDALQSQNTSSVQAYP